MSGNCSVLDHPLHPRPAPLASNKVPTMARRRPSLKDTPDQGDRGARTADRGYGRPVQAKPPAIEPLLTYKAAAKALNLPYFKMQRAARAGLFPTYRVLNGRRLLKLSEVVAVIDSTREGGDK